MGTAFYFISSNFYQQSKKIISVFKNFAVRLCCLLRHLFIWWQLIYALKMHRLKLKNYEKNHVLKRVKIFYEDVDKSKAEITSLAVWNAYLMGLKLFCLTYPNWNIINYT